MPEAKEAIQSLRQQIATLDSQLDSESTPVMKWWLRKATHDLDDAEDGLQYAAKASNARNAAMLHQFVGFCIQRATEIFQNTQASINKFGGDPSKIVEVGG